jgi:phage tail sheath protein FI
MGDRDMPEYLSPGDCIGEVAGPRSIVGVGTSTAGFAGIAAKGPLHNPGLVTSMAHFLELFGNCIPDAYLAFSVHGFFENGAKGALSSGW